MTTLTFEKTLYGPRGWTSEAQLWHIINGKTSHHDIEPPHIVDAFGRFEGLEDNQVEQILERIRPENLDDRQNRAPTCGDLMRACLRHRPDITLNGYIVGPERTDERLSIDGLEIKNCPVSPGSGEYHREPVGAERVRIWRELVDYLELDANDFNMPDEMMAFPAHNGESGTRWWLWWD